MSLEVIVDSASSLPNLESLGKIDPYVSVEYQGNHVISGVAIYCVGLSAAICVQDLGNQRHL